MGLETIKVFAEAFFKKLQGSVAFLKKGGAAKLFVICTMPQGRAFQAVSSGMGRT
ncbi:hypothetical protein [Komagataeibacter europaeus]|uniref:hypothetical protein n=1 Tax=Komagataeibacter europaeus TaxID=33995 RepID=UPI00142D64E0|nr:hypothetical protein [Komagataeibacter europaeus]